MTGPEHYTQAERLLDGGADDMARAQVHATLALVAATLDAAEQVNLTDLIGYPAEIGHWRNVIA